MGTQKPSTNRLKRRRLITALAVGMAAASMVVPSIAAARTDAGGPANPAPSITLHRDGSKAVAFVPNPAGATTPAESGNGFDWGDAMVGAGAAVALLALLGAAGLTARSRKRVQPTAAAQS